MESLTPVNPVSPAAAYLGGERNLSRHLVARIEQIPHELFADVFGGMLGVFLRRRSRPKVEAINDISADIANFFRVLQEHPAYLIDQLRYRVASRAEFDRLKAQRPELLTDLQRAARFLYLQKVGFGGKIVGRSFGVAPSQSARFNAHSIARRLPEIHERLAGVWIEQLHYADFIRRYDRPGALFYLDPPYWNGEADYGEGVFERADFARLADQLEQLQGRFVLSINDTPGAREVFGRFAIEEVAVTYTICTASAGGGQRAGELIVSSTE